MKKKKKTPGIWGVTGIVQCFVFLSFLLLLENFGLATLIPVGITVLGVKTPLRA